MHCLAWILNSIIWVLKEIQISPFWVHFSSSFPITTPGLWRTISPAGHLGESREFQGFAFTVRAVVSAEQTWVPLAQIKLLLTLWRLGTRWTGLGAGPLPSILGWPWGTLRWGRGEPALGGEGIGSLVGHGVHGLRRSPQRAPELGQLLPALRGIARLLVHVDYALINGLGHIAQGGHEAFPEWRRLVFGAPGSGPPAAPRAPLVGSSGARNPGLFAGVAAARLKQLPFLVFRSHTGFIWRGPYGQSMQMRDQPHQFPRTPQPRDLTMHLQVHPTSPAPHPQL